MALPFLGTPDSFDIAKQEQSRQRSIENTTALESIQNAIGAAVPALSGVVAGVFANSPLIGLGTAFITDQLRQGAKDRSQRRQARRLENRQRKAAADLLVESGQFQNRREALRAIEEERIKQELENVEKEKDALVQRFGLQRREKEEQEEKEEGRGDPQPVRSVEGEGLALESTVANIDDNISAIGDLILDRFADQEQNEVEQRRLQQQQLIQQREMRLEAERTQERVEEGEPEKVKDDNGFMKGPMMALLANPVVGIGLAIGALTVALAVFKDEIIDAVLGLPGAIANSLFEKLFGTSGADKESVRADALESDVKTLQNRRQQATGELDEVQKNIERIYDEMPTEEELENARAIIEREKDNIIKSAEFREARRVARRAKSPELERQKEIEQQIQERIQRIDKEITEKQTTIQELREQESQTNPYRLDSPSNPELGRVDPQIGNILADTSREQQSASGGKGVSVVDARTNQSSVTSVSNQSTTVQTGVLNPSQLDINRKYTGRVVA